MTGVRTTTPPKDVQWAWDPAPFDRVSRCRERREVTTARGAVPSATGSPTWAPLARSVSRSGRW